MIIDKYTALINDLEKYTDKTIVPVLDDDFECCELILYFNYKEEYRMVILDIIDSNNININTEANRFTIVFPMIHDFLVWFKSLLKIVILYK